MKKIILTIILTFTALAFVRSFNSYSYEKSDYTYTVIDNKVTITGFEGKPVFIDIPEIIDGYHVTEIRDNAFYECDTLRHITLPNTIEKIGHHSFYACFSLESIVIPDSVTEIGIGCFCGCSALSSVTLSENITKLPESCFRSCTSLKNIIIPHNVTEINDFSFSGCTEISAVSVGDKVSRIGDCAFYMCRNLKGIYLPPSVSEIGIYAIGYIPTDKGADLVENFTLLGKKNSVAEDYANQNSLTFENASDNVHAFAIQRISGQRVGIPSILLICIAVVILIWIIFTAKQLKTSRKK